MTTKNDPKDVLYRLLDRLDETGDEEDAQALKDLVEGLESAVRDRDKTIKSLGVKWAFLRDVGKRILADHAITAESDPEHYKEFYADYDRGIQSTLNSMDYADGKEW